MEERRLVDTGRESLLEGTVRPGVLVVDGLTHVVAGSRDSLERMPVSLSILAMKDTLVFDIGAIDGTTRTGEIGGLLLRVGDESFASISGIPTRAQNFTLELNDAAGRFSAYRRRGSNGSTPGQIGKDIEFEIGMADTSEPLTAWNQHERLARSLAEGLARLAQPKRHRTTKANAGIIESKQI